MFVIRHGIVMRDTDSKADMVAGRGREPARKRPPGSGKGWSPTVRDSAGCVPYPRRQYGVAGVFPVAERHP